MKYTTTTFSLLTLLSTTTAQSLSDVPGCASQAAFNSITGSGCPITDAACICRNQDFLDSLLPVVREACTPEEFQKTVEFTRQFCGNAGVEPAITTDAASSTATDSTTSTAVAAPSATASNGTLIPGNSTDGGVLTSPDPTPQPAPDSGVAGFSGLAKSAGMLGVVVMGAVVLL
ncbi:MAG: hypothetical protein Q9226_003244 [Calogaya cf. arnoldii]